MKKYLIHFVCAFAFLGLLVVAPAAGVNAQTPTTTGGDKVQEGLNSISDPFPDTVVDAESTPQEFIKKVIDYALYFAAIIAVIFIIYGGYLYIFSAGSDDRAKTGRKTLFNAIIGLIIIVLSYVIIQLVYRFLTDTI